MAASANPEVQLLENESFCEARYLGAYEVGRYKRQMEVSVRACEERGKKLLLVDIRALTGFEPTTQERYALGKHGAEISRGLLKVAVIGTPEQLSPDRLASLVAQNRGLKVQAFNDRDGALGWLLAP